jgi:hypothetical protein
MKTKIVQRGDFYELRISQALLNQAGLAGLVYLSVTPGSIVIRNTKPRTGWAKSFKDNKKT